MLKRKIASPGKYRLGERIPELTRGFALQPEGSRLCSITSDKFADVLVGLRKTTTEMQR